MRTHALFLLTAALALPIQAAPVPLPRPDASKAELKKLQGDWIRVAHAVEGAPLAVAAISVVISERHFTYVAGRIRQDWALTLNARSRPKSLDVECVNPPHSGLVYQGIYRLDGNTLTLCSVRSTRPADRPRDFRGTGPGQVVEVFRRLTLP
jgi:uncharacterized protein (TIGR03067 family)